MAHFHITPGVPSLSLPSSRRGQISFAVTNNLGRAVRIQASVLPTAGAKPEWLSIQGEMERDLSTAETETFIVQVQVPADVPAGEQRFRLLVASVAHPDDEYDTSPEVAFTIPPAAAHKAAFPWWIAAAAVGGIVIIVGGILLFRALHPPCITYHLDTDRDGYGTSNSVCVAQPFGSYTATKEGDCDDNDATVHPGATEICNGKDDNCNGQIDEENATGCKAYYTDQDGDSYGTGASKCLCGPAAPYRALQAGDCCDKDANARPGATAFSAAATQCGGFDFNCDGTEERQITWTLSGCTPSNCSGAEGWYGGVPGCGQVGGWMRCAQAVLGTCLPQPGTRVQSCR